MKRLTDKNILITGASSGIGRAAAIRLAKEGANLALLDINTDGLNDIAQELEQYPVSVFIKKCDVSNFCEVETAIKKIAQAIGGFQGLSHNAGILICCNTHEMTLEQWNEIISVNLTGTFNVNRHALPFLLKNETSYIVNTSSIAADHRHPWMAAYAATKGAIKSFTRSLFIEYCLQGLHANCVMPGSIESNLSNTFQIPANANPDLIKTLIPFGESKMVSADYVAGVIAMLLSNDAYHINGTEITVDGGKIF